MMRAKDALKTLKCSRVTLCKYVKLGWIRVEKKLNGRYEYNEDDVYSFVFKKVRQRERLVISYSRVSTHSQKDQLKSQTKRIYDSCISRGLVLSKQYEEIKSGMSSERAVFDEVCQEVFNGNVKVVVVENKDRLIRFGFDTIAKLFKMFDCEILVLNDVLDNTSYEQELTEDLIAIIHYFAMKSYSHRRKLNKLRRILEDEKRHEHNHSEV